MTTHRHPLSIQLRSDGRLLLPGVPEARTLLFDAACAPGADDAVRAPLAVMLAVDVSGSMGGPKIAAVREACARVVAGLDEQDLLGIVTFDSTVTTPLPPTVMDADGRSRAASVVASLQVGASTALSGGWRAAADALSVADPRFEGRGLHVVILSDGQGNEGETRPEGLAEFATATSLRGIGTSAIGVGDDWSSEQLEALAVAGGGRLHHAITPDEIAALLLGELRGMQNLGAVGLELALAVPSGFRLLPLTPERAVVQDGELRIRLGALEHGGSRTVAVRVMASDGAGTGPWAFEATLSAQDPATRAALPPLHATLRLDLAADYATARAARDEAAVREVAEHWMADFTRRVMIANRFHAVDQEQIRKEAAAFAAYCQGVDGLQEKVDTVAQLAEQANRRWSEETRKYAQMAALKEARRECAYAPRETLALFLSRELSATPEPESTSGAFGDFW